jgi:hypothetical protein
LINLHLEHGSLVKNLIFDENEYIDESVESDESDENDKK